MEKSAAEQSAKASYWHVPDPMPLSWLTVPQLVDRWAEKKPAAEAYVVRMNGSPRESLTFLQLQQKTEQLAAGLLQLGLTPGDFVLISGITCMNWIVTDLACASIGVHTIRCRMSVLTKEGLISICSRNNVKAVFFHPGEHGEFEEHLMRCVPDAFDKSCRGDEVICQAIPSLKHVVKMMPSSKANMAVELEALFLNQASLEEVRVLKRKVQPDSIYTVYMTSGSTGVPKAIPLSHFVYCNSYVHFRLMQNFVHGESRVFFERSLSWMASLTIMPLLYGCTNVHVHPLTAATDSDVDFCIRVIHEEKITSGLLLPYLITDITSHIKAGNAEPFKLEAALIGGDVIPNKILKMLGELTKTVACGYGSTEVCFIACSLIRDVCIKPDHHPDYLVDNGVEVKIVNDKGEVVPMGTDGEIVVRSPFAFRGYLQKESKGMSISKDGWIHTADVGSLHNSLLKVLGRTSNIISRGITITYPSVVEHMMMKFEGVAKVAVFGVPDPRLGQNICACVVAKEGFELTADGMLKCFDDEYQTDEGLGITPAYFMFMEAFPTNNSKVDRSALQKMAVEKFGL